MGTSHKPSTPNLIEKTVCINLQPFRLQLQGTARLEPTANPQPNSPKSSSGLSLKLHGADFELQIYKTTDTYPGILRYGFVGQRGPQITVVQYLLSRVLSNLVTQIFQLATSSSSRFFKKKPNKQRLGGRGGLRHSCNLPVSVSVYTDIRTYTCF